MVIDLSDDDLGHVTGGGGFFNDILGGRGLPNINPNIRSGYFPDPVTNDVDTEGEGASHEDSAPEVPEDHGEEGEGSGDSGGEDAADEGMGDPPEGDGGEEGSEDGFVYGDPYPGSES